MSSRARSTALLAASVALCAGCSVLAHPAGGVAASPPASSRAASPAAPATSRPAVPAVAPVLPFSPARLQAAVTLAARFAAAWDSWSWRRPPAAWLAALRPMAAASLDPALAQAAGTPAVLARRAGARQAATATVTSAAIRDLTPGSVTVTVGVRQVVTSASGTSTTAASLAVTVVPAAGGGDGWSVWDIEPANAGNS
jgi:hypothetical protein